MGSLFMFAPRGANIDKATGWVEHQEATLTVELVVGFSYHSCTHCDDLLV